MFGKLSAGCMECEYSCGFFSEAVKYVSDKQAIKEF